MSAWRKLAADARQGWDNRDNSTDFGPIVPNVPIVPPLDPVKAQRFWRAGLAGLDPCQPLNGFTDSRWRSLYDCSIWWFNKCGEQAARHGWQTGDIFGILPGHERLGGLIDRLGDIRFLEMDADAARWQVWGHRESYRRGASPELKPFWISQ